MIQRYCFITFWRKCMTVEDVVFRPGFNQILLVLKSITTAHKPSVPINKNKGRLVRVWTYNPTAGDRVVKMPRPHCL